MLLTGGPLGNLNFLVAFLENIIVSTTFKTSAVQGSGTFRPTFARAVGGLPLQWTFPDANNTLGSATHSGDLPAGFTFTLAGTKNVVVNVLDWDSFVQINAINCNLVDEGIILDSKSKALTILRLDNNQLTTPPNLQGLAALTILRLDNNQLTTPPNLQGLAALTILLLHSNQLTTPPNLQGLAALTQLHLQYNQLTTPPNLQGLAALTHLYLYNNQLTTPSIDVLLQSCIDGGKSICDLRFDANPGSGGASEALKTTLKTSPRFWTTNPA